MFAIIEVAGQQFKVENNQKIFVHRLQEKEGKQITLDKVLLIEQEGNTFVGMPVIEDYHVKATVLTHLKGDTVKVFKKKRRKGYQVLNGHRQYLTEIRIDAIEKQKAAPKKAAVKKEVSEKTPASAKKTATPITKPTTSKTKEPAKATTKATVSAKTKKSAEAKTSPGGSAPKTARATTAKKKTTTKSTGKTEKTTATAPDKNTSKKPGAKKSVDTKDSNNKKESK